MIMRLSIPGQRALFLEQTDEESKAIADFVKEVVELHNSRVNGRTVFPGLLKIAFDEVSTGEQEIVDALASAIFRTVEPSELQEIFERQAVPVVGRNKFKI
jgi:hypothetical protein